MADLSDRELLDALGVSGEQEKAAKRTPREERIVAGFEDIQRFVDEHGRLPAKGEDRDIFERLYATRLDRIRKLEECRDVVSELDHQGLLDGGPEEPEVAAEEMDDAALLAELGVEAENKGGVAELTHVKSRAERRAAEEIATRTRCEDFERFEPLFEAVQKELDTGARMTRPFRDNAEIRQGDLFILSGQKVFVAEVGEEFIPEHGRRDSRLRVIYDNRTESDILLRSLQRALNKDPHGRRITEASAGPLFSGERQDEDHASGTIYVLRSKSDNPYVAEHRDVLHKIGVTGGSVERRIANARNDATYLLADVEIVATYELYNISRTKLENLIHRFFEPARIDVEIKDRFGKPVVPREWFLVPLFVIDAVVEKIRDGTIDDYRYDPRAAKLTRA